MSGTREIDLAFSEAHYRMFPELRYFMDGQAPKEDIKIYLRFQAGWPTVVAILFCICFAYPLCYVFNNVFGISQGYTAGLVILVQVLVAGVLLSLVFPKIRQRQIRAALRARLLELGITTCRKCAYDMRGSPECCPECGTEP